MSEKIVVFILLFMLLLGAVACSAENQEKTTSDAMEKSAVTQSQNTEKPNENTDDETDLFDLSNVELIPTDKQIEFPQNIVGTAIPLIKEVYVCPDPISFDESVWELKSDETYENVFGTDIQVCYYKTIASAEQDECTVIIDRKTDTLLYLSYDYQYYCFEYIDINGDGTRELLCNANRLPKYVFEMQDGTLYLIDLLKTASVYLDQFTVTPSWIWYYFHVDEMEDLDVIECRGYADDGICYQDTSLYVTWLTDTLQIQDTKTCFYNRYQPFTSNDPRYTTEVVYKEPQNDTLTVRFPELIVHVGDRCFSYDMSDQLYYNYHADLSYQRNLVAHPTLPYFALIYPQIRICADLPHGFDFCIMSSETGEILDIDRSLYSGWYEIIYQNEELQSAVNELNYRRCTINRIVCELLPIDAGFHYVVSIEDADGNVLFDCIYETDIILQKELDSTAETEQNVSGTEVYDTSTDTQSPDGRYAVVTEQSKDSGAIVVFDTLTNTMTSMPRLEIQNRIHGEVPDSVNLYCCDLLSCEWETDSILNVQFDMKTGVSFYHQSHIGWYTYDFENGSITALSYDIAIPEPTVNTMTEAEIKAVINENLDILLTDSDGYYSVKEFIDVYPEAFENIVALGEAALPYLEKIGDQYQYIGGDTSGNNRCFLAKAAEYVIKPDLYDIVFPSPDEKYSIITARKDYSILADVFQDYDNIRLLNCLTGLTEEIFDRSDICIRNIYVEWSSDSQYAAISFGFTGYSRDIIVADVKNKKFHILPSIDEIKRIISDENLSVDYDYLESSYKYIFFLDDWLDSEEDYIQITFTFTNPNFSEAIIGQYLYDLAENKILSIDAKNESIVNIPVQLVP